MLFVYPVLFHKERKEYWVEFPDLPGCHTYGAGISEAVSSAQEALSGYLMTLLVDGKDIPAASDMEGLKAELDDIVINSPGDAGEDAGMCCGSLLNVSFLGTRGEVLLHTLEQDGIYVSTGSACSSNKKGQSGVLKAMGLKDREIEGALRFSLGRMNDISEMDIVVDRVAAAVKRFRKLGSFR